MSEPSRQDVDAVADVISRMYGSPTDPDDHLPDHCRAMARAILTSEWLAERDARQRRDGVAEVTARVEARAKTNAERGLSTVSIAALRDALREPAP